MTPQQQAAVEAYERLGSKQAAARELGIDSKSLRRLLERAEKHIDPAVKAGMTALGMESPPDGPAWIKSSVPDENGLTFSFMVKPPQDAQGIADLKAILREEIAMTPAIELPERFDEAAGYMLVLDPSDVHIGKLSVASETGHTYDASIAEHRLFTGCKALIDDAAKVGASHVLLVIGNDISHIDTPRRTSTAGTPQDTDGSIFTIFRAARNAYARVIRYALECGKGVQIVHVPSNHDWVLGYCIAETIAALFADHPNVTASEYAISERHRKYVRFGKNLLGFTHGDGARESDLPQIMMQEARPHMAECLHRYWYVHHYHHKIKKALGIRPMAREKDHIAMTVIHGGAGAMEGDNVAVEYVRSPSPPDGWHDRNGYLNRQAVEAFIHCPERGQIRRLTEWF